MDTPNFYFALKSELCQWCEQDTTNQLKPENFLPARANPSDTGYDVRCAAPEGIILKPGCYFKIPLGFRMFAPAGWWLELRPRSSAFMKHHIQALYGVIDEGFELECMFVGKYDPDMCQLLGDKDKVISFGERIGQLIPFKRQDMNCLVATPEEYQKLCANRKDSRGESGFGGSGRF